MTKYELVAHDLIDRIKDGTFAPNTQLPSIEGLCERYAVSKVTIKKALDTLETSGLITRRRGSGSFVKNIAEPHPSRCLFETSGQILGLTAETSEKGGVVRTDVHEFSVELPDSEVAHALGIEQDQFVYHIVRTRFVDEHVHATEYTYMPIDVVPNLRRSHLEESIYGYIEAAVGARIASAHRVVRAVLPTKDECAWMGINSHDPLLEIEQIGFLDNGAPFEYSISHHPNHYEFRSISTAATAKATSTVRAKGSTQ